MRGMDIRNHPIFSCFMAIQSVFTKAALASGQPHLSSIYNRKQNSCDRLYHFRRLDSQREGD